MRRQPLLFLAPWGRKGPILRREAKQDGEVRALYPQSVLIYAGSWERVKLRHCMRQGAKIGSARALRREETIAEKRLWEQLRNRTLEGFKFSRQVPIGPYIVDFVCRDQRLIVEVDGATHTTENELANDNRRTGFLKSESYTVIRFQNDEIMSGMDEVLTLILQALRNFPRQ